TPTSRESGEFLQSFFQHPWSHAVIQGASPTSPDAVPESPDSAPASAEPWRLPWSQDDFSSHRSGISRVCSGIRGIAPSSREPAQLLQTSLQNLQSLLWHLRNHTSIQGVRTISPDILPESPEFASASAEPRRLPRSQSSFSGRRSRISRV